MNADKDILKYLSNLDDDEYASLWELYSIRRTWFDKICDFWNMSLYSFKKFFRRKRS